MSRLFVVEADGVVCPVSPLPPDAGWSKWERRLGDWWSADMVAELDRQASAGVAVSVPSWRVDRVWLPGWRLVSPGVEVAGGLLRADGEVSSLVWCGVWDVAARDVDRLLLEAGRRVGVLVVRCDPAVGLTSRLLDAVAGWDGVGVATLTDDV